MIPIHEQERTVLKLYALVLNRFSSSYKSFNLSILLKIKKQIFDPYTHKRGQERKKYY